MDALIAKTSGEVLLAGLSLVSIREIVLAVKKCRARRKKRVEIIMMEEGGAGTVNDGGGNSNDVNMEEQVDDDI